MAHELGTQERILAAAIDEIEAGGEAGLRIDRIVGTAKVSVASIYQRYGNRDGLVQAAQLERYARSMQARTAEFAAATERCSTTEEFKVLVRSMLEWIASPSRYAERLTRVGVLGSASARPELKCALADAAAEPICRLAAVIRDAQARGLASSRWSPEVLSWYFSGSRLGRVEFEFIEPEGLLEEYDALFIDQALYALFGA